MRRKTFQGVDRFEVRSSSGEMTRDDIGYKRVWKLPLSISDIEDVYKLKMHFESMLIQAVFPVVDNAWWCLKTIW